MIWVFLLQVSCDIESFVVSSTKGDLVGYPTPCKGILERSYLWPMRSARLRVSLRGIRFRHCENKEQKLRRLQSEITDGRICIHLYARHWPASDLFPNLDG